VRTTPNYTLGENPKDLKQISKDCAPSQNLKTINTILLPVIKL
jgi:hypothetical protein